MLPFENRDFILSYISAMGAYTLLTKTGVLLAVVFAVSSWTMTEVVISLLCAIHAVIAAACLYTLKKNWWGIFFWGGGLLTAILLVRDYTMLVSIIGGSSLITLFFLLGSDAYSFYQNEDTSSQRVKKYHRCSVWRYLIRYLLAHKNYLVNTAVMWGVACILPMLLRQIETLFVLWLGLAVLSLNTPICILLSCDPELEQAVRFLPCQGKSFCIPYCIFIFGCNLMVDVIFLCSWQIQIGEVSILSILAAIFFALQSALFSVLLEWYRPIRNWKIESDLWHHPRKYIVPVCMLLITGAVGTAPKLIYALVGMLAVECFILICKCRRCRMKNIKKCPKCGSCDIVRIPDNGRYSSGNNIYTTNVTLFGKIPVIRYVCCECGYVENWVENKSELEKIRSAF
jgi:hypothetical protein